MHYQYNISRVVFRSDFIVGDQHTSGTGLTKRLTDFLRAASAMIRAKHFSNNASLGASSSSNGQETNSIHHQLWMWSSWNHWHHFFVGLSHKMCWSLQWVWKLVKLFLPNFPPSKMLKFRLIPKCFSLTASKKSIKWRLVRFLVGGDLSRLSNEWEMGILVTVSRKLGDPTKIANEAQ